MTMGHVLLRESACATELLGGAAGGGGQRRLVAPRRLRACW